MLLFKSCLDLASAYTFNVKENYTYYFKLEKNL